MNTRPSPLVRVLHVVDRVTGGVPVAVRSYIENSPSGFEHHVLSPWSLGSPAPVWNGLPVQHHDLGDGVFTRIRTVRRIQRRIFADVVHSHSSFAGVYGRTATRSAKRVYTPHCFSFTRTDIGHVQRAAYRSVETVLGWRTDLVAACSPGEMMLASAMPSIRKKVDFIPNVASLDTPRTTRAITAASRLRIGMLGRISSQKDPDAFVTVVQDLRSRGLAVDAVWIGDGDAGAKARLHDARVRITGWLEGHALVAALSGLDVYIHSAAWEGFPIAILDAHAMGLPILVRPIPAYGNIDPALTTTDGLASMTVAALDSSSIQTWAADNVQAWTRQLSENTRPAQRSALGRVWSLR